MKKIRFLFITLVIFLSLSSVNVFAQEDENNMQETEQEDNNENQKQEILALINDSLKDIENKLKDIDDKILNVKKQEEFEYYPAIRLSVDTPIFGMSSLVENKLRVKKDISTSDVANKYSIRDIVKNKKIRLPDSILGSIVMSTKEYSIDKKMTVPQLKLTLIKTIQYLSQVESANQFIDTQTNNIFRDYINDTKKETMKDVRDRNTKIQKSLVEVSDNIKVLNFLGEDVTEYKEEYTSISEQLYKNTKKVKNSLILDDELTELVKDSIANESKIIDLQQKVSTAYNKAVEKMDYDTFLSNLKNNFKTKYDNIKKYIDSASETKEGESDGEVVTVVNYEVTSKATLDYMKIALDEVNTEIKNINKDKKEESSEENKEEEEQVENSEDKKAETKEEKEKKIEDNKQKIDEWYSKYKEVLSREHRFYIDNINMLLRDSNDKMSSIIAQINSGIKIKNDIFNYTKYIYVDLPESLNNYMDENNINSMIEKSSLISKLKKELSNLSKINKSITTMYDEVISEIFKS